MSASSLGPSLGLYIIKKNMYQYYSTTKPRTSKPIHTMVDLESRSIYTRVRIERKGARFIAHSVTQNPSVRLGRAASAPTRCS